MRILITLAVSMLAGVSAYAQDFAQDFRNLPCEGTEAPRRR